jgi:3-deoxy-manno-octulosonate cytidylyltransferase (CMP-KDO synthetase)
LTPVKILRTKPKIIAILPARMGSTRLPRKPLLELGGEPIIVHTYKRVKSVFETIYVATDHQEIAAVCASYNIPVIMTSSDHLNGTSRCLEAYEKLDEEFDFIVNVQGDEAFISDDILEPLLDLLTSEGPEAATIIAPIQDEHRESNVFVVHDRYDHAMLFSRSPIPFSRDGAAVQRSQHVGVYSFTPDALRNYCSMAPTTLELAESLEQLRWMEYGRKWKLARAPRKPLSIDTFSDYEAAKSRF